MKDLVRAAGVRDGLTFREWLAQGRHTGTKVPPLHTKRTMRQVASGTWERHASRTDAADVSQ